MSIKNLMIEKNKSDVNNEAKKLDQSSCDIEMSSDLYKGAKMKVSRRRALR